MLWRHVGARLGIMMNNAPKRDDRARQSLRLDAEMWNEIDRARATRMGNISRNTWIAEAVREKLQREAANDRGAAERQHA